MARDTCNAVASRTVTPESYRTDPPYVENVVGPEPLPPPPPWVGPQVIGDIDVTDGRVLYWLATLARASYVVGAFESIQAARALFPDSVPVVFHANNDQLTPGWCLVNAPEFCVLVISGTSNLGQWLEQTVLGQLVEMDPVEVGGVDKASTMTLYKNASLSIYTAVEALAPGKPILLCGHSMGGAVAALVAYRMRRASATRPIRLVTFAAPKPGVRVADEVNTADTHYARLAIEGDFVPGLPPDLSAAEWAVPVPLRPKIQEWASYKQLGQRNDVRLNGEREPTDDAEPVGQLATVLLRAAAGQPIDLAASHRIKEFCFRLGPVGSIGTGFGVTGWRDFAALVGVNARLEAVGL